MFRKLIHVLFLSALVGSACTSSPAPRATSPTPPSSPAATSGPRVGIDPASFASTIDNPFLPFAPGMTFVYEGTKDGERLRDEVKVTDRTKIILGVPCVVVEDTATQGGKPVEQTEDWYAQDKDGNVWLFRGGHEGAGRAGQGR
jgi:hypothetical protein